MEWQKAVPVDYLNEVRDIGQVYVASVTGPPLMVKPRTIGDEGDASIVVEVEDMLGLAAEQLGLPNPNPGNTLRMAMHLGAARKLCHNLIVALAESGDRVANRIQFMMRQAMEDVRAQDEKK